MNKYLKELGYKKNDFYFNMPLDKKDSRYKKWKQEKIDYGFDSRETWDLDSCAETWLYCHLKMFLEKASGVIDLTYHHYIIPVLEELAEKELVYPEGCRFPETYVKKIYVDHDLLFCINQIIKYLEYALTEQDIENAEEDIKNDSIKMDMAKCAFEIFSIILPSMWW